MMAVRVMLVRTVGMSALAARGWGCIWTLMVVETPRAAGRQTPGAFWDLLLADLDREPPRRAAHPLRRSRDHLLVSPAECVVVELSRFVIDGHGDCDVDLPGGVGGAGKHAGGR